MLESLGARVAHVFYLVRAIHTVALARQDLPPSTYGCCQILEDVDSHLPVNAGICDADTLLQGGRAFRRNFLVSATDI